jgi:hypothetical protein
MRIPRVLSLLAALFATLFLVSCAGTGVGGGSGGHQAGIYFIDSGNNRLVWTFDMGATFFTSFDSSISAVPSIYNGSVDASGRIYLIDSTNSSIVRFSDLAGGGRVVFGSHGGGTNQFLNPVRVTADISGNVYVVDRDRNALVRFRPGTANWNVLDLSPWYSSSDEPDVTTDRFGHIFLAGGTQVVQLTGFSAVGALTFGTGGSGVGQFSSLNGICLDDQQRIYVADGGNNRIARINSIAGAGWVAFGSTGAGTGQFDIAFGVSVDHIGRVYVGDRNNHRLVRVDTMGGGNWTELDNLPSGPFSFVLSVFVHLPNF